MTSHADHSSWIFVDGGFGLKRVLSTAVVERPNANATPQTYSESNKVGFPGSVRLVYSYYWNDWAAEIGIGGYTSRLLYVGFDPDGLNSNRKRRTMNRDNLIATLVPRFRPNDHFSIGPLFRAHFLGNTEHSEDPRESARFALSGGAELVFEYPLGEASMFRWGIQGDLDLTEAKRSVAHLMLIIGYGIRLSHKSIPLSEKNQRRPRKRWNTEIESTSVSQTLKQHELPSARVYDNDKIRILFPADEFLFQRGTSAFRNEKRLSYLRDLLRFLRNQRLEVKRVVIESRSDEANMKQRARAVFREFQKVGHSTSRIETKSMKTVYSSSVSSNTTISLDVTASNPLEIEEAVKRLNRQYGFSE